VRERLGGVCSASHCQSTETSSRVPQIDVAGYLIECIHQHQDKFMSQIPVALLPNQTMTSSTSGTISLNLPELPVLQPPLSSHLTATSALPELPPPNLLSLAHQPVQQPSAAALSSRTPLPSSSSALSAPAMKYLDALRALPKCAHGPCIDITYDIKDVTIDVPSSSSSISNVGLSIVNFISGPFRPPQSVSMKVIHPMTGVLKSGTSTLIIGNAGCGKTTLLRLLAGRDSLGKEEGHILWNDTPSAASFPSKLAGFAPQIDVHEPMLTVRETFEFAAASCLAPLAPDASAAERALRSSIVDHVMDALELRECENVILGNELARGVSGGQKKRVTIGEVLLSGARILSLDEVTNGLDSATASSIMSFICSWARLTGGTVVAALQAPTPEILATFDDVILLSDGHEFYHGPSVGLNDFFAKSGFIRPEYMDPADYALSMCVSPSYVASTFGTVPGALANREALAAAWSAQRPALPARNVKEQFSLQTPAERAQWGVQCVHSQLHHLKLLTARQGKIVFRNPAVSFGRVFQFIVLGSIFGSIYYKLPFEDFVAKISLAMFALSAVSFAAFSEIPAIFVGKKTASKQMEGGFFQPFAFVLSVILNSLPTSLLSTFIFATIMYWMVGYADDVGRYFFFTLALVIHELAISALFRLYSFALPTEELAQAASGITTGASLIFGGFYIAYPKIPPFMWPVYYLSPFSWTVRAIVDSEFTSAQYMASVYPGGPTYSDTFLDAFGFKRGLPWKWGGLGLLLGYAIILGPVLSSIIVKYFRYRERPGSRRISEDAFIQSASAASSALDSSLASSSSLPFSSGTLTFEQISYSVTLPDKSSKPLLRGISGFATPGTMTALMGASGAGKTTLLDVLAGRKTTGEISGRILVNGAPADGTTFKTISAFAEQEDVHADQCTVREALEFSAALRLPKSVSASAREDFVSQILTLLELTPLATRSTESLSQGERKRLTIGVELTANPSILFADEPTTGLDARAAAIVVRVMKRIAATGRTIVATIHQPSAEVFFSFDQLLVLVPGGTQAYLGPLGTHASALVAFLQNVPGVAQLPSSTNPATWMLQELSAPSQQSNHSGQSVQPRHPGSAVVELSELSSVGARHISESNVASGFYAGSSLFSSNASTIAALNTSNKTPLLRVALPGFFKQFFVLTHRMWMFMWRCTSWNSLRMFVFVFLSIFFGLLYLQIDDSDQSGAFSKMAVALNGILFISIISLNTGLPNYSRLRAVFYRERGAGYYASAAFPMSVSICEIPWTLFFCLLYVCINYFVSFSLQPVLFSSIICSHVFCPLGRW
jgi:ABC-type multidrug transport system ATPase subunit